MAMLESDYTHADSPKPAPEVPVRVFLKSQLMAALRQHSRPIIIEDLDLALPFIRVFRKAVFDRQVATFNITALTQAAMEPLPQAGAVISS
jgi:hypothetical protein